MYARMLVFDMYGDAVARMPLRLVVSGVAFTLTVGGWHRQGVSPGIARTYTWAGMIASLSERETCHDVYIARPGASHRCCAHTIVLADALLAMAEDLARDDDLSLLFESAMTL